MSQHNSETCIVCGGEASRLGYAVNGVAPGWRVCRQVGCAAAAAHMSSAGQMPDTPYEHEALDLTGRVAGKHLMALGKTDLKTMTKGEWQEFIRVVVSGWRSEVARLTIENAPPF